MPVRRGEGGAIPPILLVQFLRNALQQVLAKVEIWIHPVLFERLQNGCGHSMDRIPNRVFIVGERDGRSASLQILCGSELPVLGQLDASWGVRSSRRRQDARTQRQEQRNYKLEHVPSTPVHQTDFVFRDMAIDF